MKRLILLCFVFICSCEMPLVRDCDSYNSFAAGICIKTVRPVDLNEVEILVDVLEEEVKKYYPEVPDLRTLFEDNGIRVDFIDGDISLKCDYYSRSTYVCERDPSGVNYDGWDIHVEYSNCLAFSMLSHELEHSIEFFYLGLEGNKLNLHMTPWLFTNFVEDQPIKIMKTVEWLVERRLACTLKSCEKLHDTAYCTTYQDTIDY